MPPKIVILFLFFFLALSCKQSNPKALELIILIENPDLTSQKREDFKKDEVVLALMDHAKFHTQKSFNDLKNAIEKHQKKTVLSKDWSEILNIGLQELDIYKLNQQLYNEDDLESVKNIIAVNLKKHPLRGNKVEAYYHLKYLHLYAKYLEKKSRYKHAISCLHMGRHHLEKSSSQEIYRNLYSIYLSFLSVCYFHDDNNSKVVSEIMSQHPFWKTQNNGQLKSIQALLCLYQQYENVSNTEKAESVFKEASALAKHNQDVSQLNISRFYNEYFLRSSPDAIKHLYNSLSQTNTDLSSIGYFDVVKELMHYHLENKNVDSAKVYLSRLLQYDTTTNHKNNSLVQYFYFSGLYSISKIIKDPELSSLHYLEKKLEYANKYGGSSFDHHLSDAFNDILIEATETLPAKKWVKEQKSITTYLNIFHLCDKFLFKKQLYTNLTQDSKYNTEIEALLVKSNDLQNLQQITPSYADSVFSAFEGQLRSSISLSSNPGKSVSWTTLSDFLKSDGAAVLLSILGENKLHLIYITHLGIYRSTVPLSPENNFIHSFPALLSNQNILSSIEKQLPPFDFKNTPLLYLIGSGDSYKIPFDGLKYKNKFICEWVQTSNALDLPSIISAKEVILTSSQMRLFGFSDEKTKDEISPKEIVELPLSVTEVNQLQSLFHLSTSYVFKGMQMTTDRFLNNSNNTWVHISSHSYTSDTIRRANKMVFRSKDGYDYFQNADVLKMKGVPGFVFLNSCEGGQGMANESEIQNSLANAFHEIGCPSTLSNLWSINDKNALQFSLDFYSVLLEGCDVGESIRLSKLKNIGSTENECFGYVLTGNPKIILNLVDH